MVRATSSRWLVNGCTRRHFAVPMYSRLASTPRRAPSIWRTPRAGRRSHGRTVAIQRTQPGHSAVIDFDPSAVVLVGGALLKAPLDFKVHFLPGVRHQHAHRRHREVGGALPTLDADDDAAGVGLQVVQKTIPVRRNSWFDGLGGLPPDYSTRNWRWCAVECRDRQILGRRPAFARPRPRSTPIARPDESPPTTVRTGPACTPGHSHPRACSAERWRTASAPANSRAGSLPGGDPRDIDRHWRRCPLAGRRVSPIPRPPRYLFRRPPAVRQPQPRRPSRPSLPRATNRQRVVQEPW